MCQKNHFIFQTCLAIRPPSHHGNNKQSITNLSPSRFFSSFQSKQHLSVPPDFLAGLRTTIQPSEGTMKENKISLLWHDIRVVQYRDCQFKEPTSWKAIFFKVRKHFRPGSGQGVSLVLDYIGFSMKEPK